VTHIAAQPRRAPRAPLCPYTTLFRSQIVQASAEQQAAPMDRFEFLVADWHNELNIGPFDLIIGADLLYEDRNATDVATFLGRHLDRKSTRLNSSHLGISYAVFCLKKK